MTAPSDHQVPAVLDQALPVPSLVSDMDSVAVDFWCSWPIATDEDKELVFRARHNEAKDLSTVGDVELHVVNILAHNCEREDRNGDGPEKFTRIALIMEDGSIYESFSKGVKETAKYLIFMAGHGPWQPPIRVKVRRIKGSQPSPLEKLEYLGRCGGKTDAKKSK